MKKISQVINEAKKGLEIQDNTINYIPTNKLNEYVKICEKFLCPEAMEVITYLLLNNDTYVKDFSKGSGGNALADFYDAGVPKDKELKDLYKNIGLLVKSGNLMQVPVFQTEEQFNAILKKEVAPDEVFLDLETEKGRNAVTEKYKYLIKKIVNSFHKKSAFSDEDIHGFAMIGFTEAMNKYGKSASETQKKKKEEEYDNPEDKELAEKIKQEKEAARKAYTFKSYAAYMMRIEILEGIKNQSHLVRVPISQQNREREETGRNTVSMHVSGDEVKSTDKDGKTKTLFDKIGDTETGGKGIDNEDLQKLMDQFHKLLYQKVKESNKKYTDEQVEKMIGMFVDKHGIFGAKELSGKEIMQKYGLKNQSEISNNQFKIRQIIYNDKRLMEILKDIQEILNEGYRDEIDLYATKHVDRVTDDYINQRLEEQNTYVEEEYDYDEI